MNNTSVENLVGRYDQDEKTLDKVKTDFGKIAEGQPIGCLFPKTIGDIQSIIKHCKDEDIPVITRGMSHSASGQCLINGGVVINIKTLNKVLDIQFDGQNGYVITEAGITWENLVKATLEVGATPPTITDWQKLTVGGSISTGGLGFMSYLKGVQADNILALDVVVASGDLIHCSRTENTDLFNLVRAGLGQFGVIVKVKMKLEKAPITMHVFKMMIPTTNDFHELSKRLTEECKFACIHSFLIPNNKKDFEKKMGQQVIEENIKYFQTALDAAEGFSYFVELVQYEYKEEAFQLANDGFDVFTHYEKDDYFEYITKEPPLIATEKERGKTAHPELAVFIAKSKFESFMKEFLKRHHAEDMSDGPVLCIPMTSGQIETPLFVHPEEDFYFIGILRNAYPNTKERIAYLTGLNEVLYSIALELGGNRYPVDSMAKPYNRKTWSEHYGKAWKAISNGKSKYDAENRFQSLLNMFGE
jgi:cytokinin dehydrogenase